MDKFRGSAPLDQGSMLPWRKRLNFRSQDSILFYYLCWNRDIGSGSIDRNTTKCDSVPAYQGAQWSNYSSELLVQTGPLDRLTGGFLDGAPTS